MDLELSSNYTLQNAAQQALKTYKRKMNEKICGSRRRFNERELYNFHSRCKSEAMREYKVYRHTSFLHEFEYYREKLDKDVNEELKIFKKNNKKRSYVLDFEEDFYRSEEEEYAEEQTVDYTMMRRYSPPSAQETSSTDFETIGTIVAGVGAIAAAAFIGYKIYDSTRDKRK